MPANSTDIFLFLLGSGRLRRAAAEEQELPRQQHADGGHITDTHIGENCTALTFEACKPMRNLRSRGENQCTAPPPPPPLQLPGGGGGGGGGGGSGGGGKGEEVGGGSGGSGWVMMAASRRIRVGRPHGVGAAGAVVRRSAALLDQRSKSAAVLPPVSNHDAGRTRWRQTAPSAGDGRRGISFRRPFRPSSSPEQRQQGCNINMHPPLSSTASRFLLQKPRRHQRRARRAACSSAVPNGDFPGVVTWHTNYAIQPSDASRPSPSCV